MLCIYKYDVDILKVNLINTYEYRKNCNAKYSLVTFSIITKFNQHEKATMQSLFEK